MARSTPLSAPVRCAMTTTIPPRARAVANVARVSASSPSKIEVGVRFVENKQKGIADRGHAQARFVAAAQQTGTPPLSPISVSYPLGRCKYEVMDTCRLSSRDDSGGGIRIPPQTAQCSAPPCPLKARRPVADSRCVGQGTYYVSIVRAKAPSMRIVPRAGAHKPTRARARLDLPAALGPIMPRALPFFALEGDILHAGRFCRQAG